MTMPQSRERVRLTIDEAGIADVLLDRPPARKRSSLLTSRTPHLCLSLIGAGGMMAPNLVFLPSNFFR